MASPIRTPQALWKDFDPRKEPLEIVTVRRWVKDGSRLHAFYFTGETCEGDKARIYAIYGVPKNLAKGKKLPAMLHIHGGGQTANTTWLTFWNGRGYAALTFNWGGLWDERSRTAIWGDRLHHCNHKHCAGGIEVVRPSPKENSWYHWTLASRRALTALERQKEVDAKRLGIFGISMGGTIVWNFAGTDPRVRAACAIYGVGWNTYPNSKYAADPRARDADTMLYRKTIAPEAYGPLVKCPVLFLSGSNDFHGKLDRAYDTLNTVGGPWAAAFTPHYNHHVAEPQGRSLPLWMDTFVKARGRWPDRPVAEVLLDDGGVPMLTVRPDASEPVARVEVYCGLENENPKTRHWRTLVPRRRGDVWTVAMPVMNARKRLFAFAQVYYKRGICTASNLEAVIPADLGKARATDTRCRQLADFSEGLDDFATTCVGTDPCVFCKGLVRRRGPRGRMGIRSVTGAAVITRKLGDPKWRGPDKARLAFDVFVSKAATLNVAVKKDEGGPGQKVFQARVALKPGRGWQRVRLPAGRFKDDTGRALGKWRAMEHLEIATTEPLKSKPLFTNFRWIPHGR